MQAPETGPQPLKIEVITSPLRLMTISHELGVVRITRSRSLVVAIGMPFTATTMSPFCRPARAAKDPSSTDSTATPSTVKST